MTDLISVLAAAVFLVFGVDRLVRSRAAEADPAQRYLAGLAGCMGTAMLFNAPAVVGTLSGEAGLDTPVLLITHELKTAGLGFLVLVGLAVKSPPPGPRSVRRQIALNGAVLIASAALFGVADIAMVDDELTVPDGHRWALAGYNVLFALYGCWCLLVLTRELARHARRMSPGPLRAGLRLMVLSAVFGAVWTLWALADVPADLREGRQGVGEDAVSASLSVITAVLATAGASASLLEGPLGTPVRRLRAFRRFRALEPLWSALHAQLPQIALDESAAARRPGLRGAEFALYRRVIEIRDGYLALRPYFDAGVPGWTSQTADLARDRRAVLEAAMIAAALENLRAGQRQDGVRRERDAVHVPSVVVGTVESESEWLVGVCAAFTSSPVVARVRSRVRSARAG
ncbi:MAB_1171c family putative transporter [Streptomyces sp. AcH 505]|uniref:MAB_1171c family putative transporter n=1 Tax=Streptomyces sp. AcH 505 TaxID=352211 RepID=UPI0006944014